MVLRFFNTLGRKKMEFKPIKEGFVNMYSCGPTVYNYMHIGNLRAFMFTDLLKRYLKFKGFKVKHVMNITDVDDKTIRDSQKQGKTLKDFTEFYTKVFLEDLDKLNIEKADIMPKATDHIKEMVEMIKKMTKKGNTYEKAATTYARISSIKNYGELACLDPENLKQNADGRLNDSDEYEKDDARDFALWKAYSEDDGDVFWETDIGKGRPGWHIECSVMSTKYLGETFDIHTGGVDLIFPHHTNEIAQTEAATGKRWVNYWLHNEHLIVNGEKMSKSLGNFFTLKDLTDKGYDPRAIRYEFIKTHYRVKLDFSEEELKKIPETLAKFDELIDKMNNLKNEKGSVDGAEISEKYLKEFEEVMDDDLNISGGLASIFEFMKEVNKQIDENTLSKKDALIYLDTLKKFDSVLGVMRFEKQDVPKEIIALAEKRKQARAKKDWAESDKLRDEIKAEGYEILDEKDGYRIKKN